MNTVNSKLILGLLVLVNISCKEKSTEIVNNQSPLFSYSSSKCVSYTLNRIDPYALNRDEPYDSSFSYTFTDKLIVDFSVPANCCPDSNRFIVSNTFNNDTLLIMVVDTAEYVCKCICTYLIRAVYENLTNDHYIVRCTLENKIAPYMNRDPLHLVNVYRLK